MTDAELIAIRDRIVEGIPIQSDHWKEKILEALELVRYLTRKERQT